MGKGRLNVGELPAMVLLKKLYPSSDFTLNGVGDSGKSPDILRRREKYMEGNLEGIEVTTVDSISRHSLRLAANSIEREEMSDDLRAGIVNTLQTSFTDDYRESLCRGLELFFPNSSSEDLLILAEACREHSRGKLRDECVQLYEIGKAYEIVDAVRTKRYKWTQGHYEDCKYKSVAAVLTESLNDLEPLRVPVAIVSPIHLSLYVSQLLDKSTDIWSEDEFGVLWRVYIVYEVRGEKDPYAITKGICTLTKGKFLDQRVASMSSTELLYEVRKEWEFVKDI